MQLCFQALLVVGLGGSRYFNRFSPYDPMIEFFLLWGGSPLIHLLLLLCYPLLAHCAPPVNQCWPHCFCRDWIESLLSNRMFVFSFSAQSCRGRCDEPFQRGRVCECDSQCLSYNTCCHDYQLQCRKRQHTHDNSHTKLLSIRLLTVVAALYCVYPQKLVCQFLTMAIFTLWGLQPTVSTVFYLCGCLFMLVTK